MLFLQQLWEMSEDIYFNSEPLFIEWKGEKKVSNTFIAF